MLFLFAGCAKMGYLEGGKKDEKPPVLINSKPHNYSTNINTQKIEINFDEYIVLKNVSQELIISPPLAKKPDVRLKNKTIIIDLKNELRENTTYTLNFGNAIADNNEGNSLTNFEFVFSTGPYLDSLSVNGTILNAFNLQASKEPIVVGLYDQLEDSVPMKTIPVYIGKTDNKGNFMINNIKADTFKLFALKDLNYNLLFDLPNEEIAFIDTLIFLNPEFLLSLPVRIVKPDSTTKEDVGKENFVNPGKKSIGKNRKSTDSPQVTVDSLQKTSDSDSTLKKPLLPAFYVDMFYFIQEGTRQYMTNKDRLNKESFQLSFNLPLKDDPIINVLDYNKAENWCITEINAKRDTFTYWITDTVLIKSDTLKLEVQYPMSDSMGAIFNKLDTIKFITRTVTAKTGRGKTEEKKPIVKLAVSTLRNNGLLDYNTDFTFRFNFPLYEIDTSLLRLYVKVDTIEILQKYELVRDSTSSRIMILKSQWKEKAKYRIRALPGAFNDIYYHSNDTLTTNFTLQEKTYYGKLIVTLSELTTPVMVQLMNEKEIVLRTKNAETDGKLIFDLLNPGKYIIKFVFDVNGNNKWDTGDYLKNIQPEKVIYYIGEINIRSNWDLEVNQNMGTQ